MADPLRIAGFSLSPFGDTCASADGLVGYTSARDGWGIRPLFPSIADRLRRAGIDDDTRFPTRREATEAAVAVVGCDRRTKRSRSGTAYRVDGEEMVWGGWHLCRRGRRWGFQRNPFVMCDPVEDPAELESRLFSTRRSALLELRERRAAAIVAATSTRDR